jgi:RNA polymerase sigma-70 factor (ECF subfamily)
LRLDTFLGGPTTAAETDVSDATHPACPDCPCDREAQASGWMRRLVHDHRAHLVAVARGEGLPPEDAFDAVQEAFSALLVLPGARERAAAPEPARALLVTLTRNVARNARRLHAAARPHVSEAEVLEALLDDAPAADARLERAEVSGRLARCVRRLADVQRATVTLRMLDELPGEDVARLLGLSSGHVAVLLHRAKASLFTCMTEESPP